MKKNKKNTIKSNKILSRGTINSMNWYFLAIIIYFSLERLTWEMRKYVGLRRSNELGIEATKWNGLKGKN